MTNEPFKDRRKYPRIYRNFIIHCRVKGTEMVHEICQIHDISRGGAAFASTTAFTKGSVLTIELKTPFLNNTVVLEGVIIHTSVKIKDVIHSIHLQWANLSEQAVNVLTKIEQYSAQ